MNKKAIVKKVLLKLAQNRKPGTFFILGGSIYYSKFEGGLKHKDLWRSIIKVTFPKMELLEKLNLSKAYEGVDRGQLTWVGEIKNDKPFGNGKWLLEGSSGCKEYQDKILKVFNLEDDSRLEIRWDKPVISKEKNQLVQNLIIKYHPNFKNTFVAHSF